MRVATLLLVLLVGASPAFANGLGVSGEPAPTVFLPASLPLHHLAVGETAIISKSGFSVRGG